MGVKGKKRGAAKPEAAEPEAAKPAEPEAAEPDLSSRGEGPTRPPRAPEEDGSARPPPKGPAERASAKQTGPAAAGEREKTTDRVMKLAATVSLMSVIVLATVGNVFASRHFVRWDFTTSGEFTLSDGTVDTLKALDEKVTLVVLVSRDTPIGTSIAELLEGYQQHTKMLEIEFVDVDRDRARLLELQKLYGIETAEADGHTVIDAAMIVIQGDRHRYVLGGELVEVEDAADMRARPRLEYAITSAIRHVRATKPPVICFTTGHNELSFEKSGGEGMAELRDTLRKNNFEVATVFEPTADAPSDPLVGCQMLVVATPRAEIPKEHALAMVSFVEGGGNALVVLGPMPNKSQTDFVDVGLGDLLALAGVKVEKDYVHELDPSMIPRDSDGSTYFADAQVHPVTEKLIREQAAGIGALLSYSSSLTDAGGSIKPEPLLTSSPKSWGVMDFFNRFGAFQPTAADLPGPRVLAVAVERPPKPGQEKGARIIVASAANLLLGINWSDPQFTGNALFTQGAFAWLASHERFLDIPTKPLKTTGLRLTEETLSSTFHYVVLAMPLFVGAVGVGVFFSRRRRPAARKEAE